MISREAQSAGDYGLTGPEATRFDEWQSHGGVVLGPHASHAWRSDPRRFPITLERHREIQRALLARRAAARDA